MYTGTLIILMAINLCIDYKAAKVSVLNRRPEDISLREFMHNFTKKWNYAPADVFPYFIPTYQHIIKEGKVSL